MIALALLLGTIGVADLARTGDTSLRLPALIRPLTAGAAVLVLGVWGATLPWWWAPTGFGLLVLWTVTTSMLTSADTSDAKMKQRIHPWPLVALTLVLAAILASNALLPQPQGWLTDWYSTLGLKMFDGVPFERFALTAAGVIFLCESTNIVVRMVIRGAGANIMASGESLKGGRILGPIERIFILAMGLSGEILAITAVVAAKGILRYPEISGSKNGNKAEYVLVGSFVSWAIALIWLMLLR